MKKCRSCEQEKVLSDIDGYLLCEECAEEVIRCGYCGTLLGLNYDELFVNNFGTLRVPELSLPDKLISLTFCNIEHLEEYLKRYKEEKQKEGCIKE